jgi:hypothetical protein
MILTIGLRVNVMQSLLANYSKEHKMTGPHADNTTVGRLTKHFPWRVLQQKGNKNP